MTDIVPYSSVLHDPLRMEEHVERFWIYKMLITRFNLKFNMPSCRRQTSRPLGWEVVDHKAVRPISGYGDDDDIELLRISRVEMRGTYLFDLKGGANQIQKALLFSRQQLMEEASKQGYNIFLVEGWEVTSFRKGVKRRVEVQYQARPAFASGVFVPGLPPPFMELVRFVL